jgi:peptidylprolyl isomerase
VIEGFMAQTGDPTGTGTGGSGQKLRAEFTGTSFERGIVGMARSQSPDSGDSQFFIMFAAGPFLNGQYTVWGEVIEGMDAVDKLARGEPPRTPSRIVRMRLAK